MKASDLQAKAPEFLTVSDVMDLFRISKATVYRLKDSGRIPFYKLLGGVRFRREDIERYIQLCRQDAFINQDEYGSSK